MIVKETGLKGCVILEPRVFEDERGYFFESYNRSKFNELIGREINFVQDNQSYSRKGVIRALHYQTGEYAQAKLVRVLKGAVLDVAVDLRKDSETFGKHIAVELSDQNSLQLFIPRGFAHGFIVLSNTAEFFYKCDNFYNKESEGGIIYNDKELNIDWKLDEKDMIVSDKDKILPNFRNARL
ncbi:dTDP-4-dehydrorhamnose 3,5-epimerase [Spongiivirga citrea]|uniref:dTDP-4-dehydrorhamnose 3,5-epimerase n=1 Tax=Spongiivirga citrea TaxID=1481457 RepID=A0A6M0CS53_9FLAO|nr:dTDP-4-dehydrorhamnose 3,5-epimerase [Spongiivirga citrea]NER18904.1 dTDP-4-dehydrorhamnose 3,5-epimerase [Spongiivirga citrea]